MVPVIANKKRKTLHNHVKDKHFHLVLGTHLPPNPHIVLAKQELE